MRRTGKGAVFGGLVARAFDGMGRGGMLAVAAAFVVFDVAPLPGSGGCGGGESEFEELEIEPSATSIRMSQTAQFDAVAVYNRGERDNVTGEAEWSSSDEGIATINGNGLATPTGYGNVTITATWSQAEDSALLTVVR